MYKFEHFTIDDVNYLMDMLNGINEGDVVAISTSTGSTGLMFEPVVIPLEEFDLELIESGLHGVTDPIGQLKDWLYDRLKELASWFADTVSSIFEDFYNTFIKPMLDTIDSTVSSIWDYITQIPDLGKSLLEWLEDSIETIWDWIEDYIITPLTNAFKDLIDNISSLLDTVIDFLTETLPQTMEDVIGEAWDWIQDNLITPLTNAFKSLTNLISGTINELNKFLYETLPSSIQSISDLIQKVASDVWDWIQENLIDPLSQGLQGLGDLVSQVINTISSFFTDTLPSLIDQALATLSDLGNQVWNWIQDNIINPLTSSLQNLINYISEGFDTIANFFTQTLPSYIDSVIDSIAQMGSKIWDWIQDNLITPLSNALGSLANYVSEAINTLSVFFTSTLPSYINAIVDYINQAGSQIWDWIEDNLINPLTNALQGLVSLVSQGIDIVTKYLTETLPNQIRQVGEELVKLPEKTFEALKIAGMTIWDYLLDLGESIGNWFTRATKMLDQVAKALNQVGVYLTGFVNSIERLPELLYGYFKPVLEPIAEGFKSLSQTLNQLWEGLQGFVSDPWGWLQKNMFEPLWNSMQWIGGKIWEGLQWFGGQVFNTLQGLWKTISDGVSTAVKFLTDTVTGIGKELMEFFEKIMKSIFFNPLKALTDKAGELWFKVFTSKTSGEMDLAFKIAYEFLWEYWRSTLLVYIISSLPRSFGDFEIRIDPSVLGSKLGGATWKIKFSEILDSLVKGLRDFYPSFLTGTFVGIGSTLMRPVEYAYRLRFVSNYDEYVKEMYGELLKEEIEKGAYINMFVETPGLNEIKDWVRRHLVLTQGLKNKKLLDKIIATMKAHLKLYGLPRWYIDYLADTGEKLIYKFTDRFGKERTILLSTLFELPTHSELARMTQRDIFPGVNVIKQLGWIRGWNDDLSVLMYLLTFKYPSFEKLWKFYMRATSGLLWFKPPEKIREMFRNEAEQIGAGVPVAPIELQEKIRGGEQLKAFETALNTYFKWLEYSNFSWFTPDTIINGVPVGREVYSQLGGWTADSWIMVDVSADIPGKIDLRWMSRYGIFIYMADRLEQAGISFKSYLPMVKALPQLLDQQAKTPIQVDLKWFSKLLQGTGLHPAWIPIVTVAENIMAISDEMTLLRTGWLNLFKEGLLDVTKIEEYLAGLLTVSYKVGYWDVEAKEWREGWINLPVRWLPHERRLLQLRMAIDRTLDLYREIERYVVSGVRTLAITSKEALTILNNAVTLLNTHYSGLTKAITGKEMTIAFDEEYEKLRLQLFTMIQEIEVKERIRYWWFRVSGWLLYRIAYGYVTVDDINKLAENITKVVPITDKEIEAFKGIAEAIIGIVRREYVPTPSQLATLSEYMVIPESLIEKAFKQRQIPEEWRDIWKKYIEIKPLIDDVKRAINNYYRAKRYGVKVSQDIEKQVQALMNLIGFTDREKRIRELSIALEQMVSEASRYRQLFEPTYSFLATLSEYVDLYEFKGFTEFMDEFVNKLIALGVNEILLRAMVKYIHVRPVKSDYKSLLYTVIKAYIKGVVSKDVLDDYMKKAPDYGFTKRELDILSKKVEFEALIEESKEYVPTPSMLATMSEYMVIPESLIEKVFEIRRVPKEWRDIWRKYIAIKPLADDVRYLLSVYIRVKRYGVTLPEDIENSVKKILNTYGITKTELEIRELAVALDLMRESLPTLSQLGSMAEYIEIPEDFVKKVLKARRVPPDYAELWIKYISVRTISSEVNELVSQYRRIYEYFFVTPETTRQVIDIMKQGGWTDRELKIFNVSLELRKAYRVMAYMIPTIRQAVYDAYYIPEWEALFDDLLKARGIDVTKYRKQVDYYKKLARNRLVWRQIAWYRNRLVYAYANGIIDKNTLVQKLQALKKYGLTDEEIQLIVEGAELEKQRIIKIYGTQ